MSYACCALPTCQVNEVHLGAEVVIGRALFLIPAVIPLCLFRLCYCGSTSLLDSDGENGMRARRALVHTRGCRGPAPGTLPPAELTISYLADDN